MEKSHIGKSICLHVAILNILLLVVVIDGVAVAAASSCARNTVLDTKMRRLVKPFKKLAAVKTIQSEDGDIIDCVDIFKQPALDHPALVNHTIQMRPSSEYNEEMSSKASSSGSLAQLGRMNGSCPEGTIPIIRTKKTDRFIEDAATTPPKKEGAKLVMTGQFYGASAWLNLWDLLHVQPGEDSFSSVMLGRNNCFGDNIIAAGWMVSGQLYGDQKTRFTIYWTADGSRTTGCHNHNCAGFVQVNSQIPLGSTFNNSASVYGGTQQEMSISIYLDRQFNNWWLNYYDAPVGYWPASIFKNLVFAEILNWGGDVGLYCDEGGLHSATEMGSGHYPSEGYKKSAYIAGALFMGNDNKYRPPEEVNFWADNPPCYNTEGCGRDYFNHHGYAFFYGGNGQGKGCSA